MPNKFSLPLLMLPLLTTLFCFAGCSSTAKTEQTVLAPVPNNPGARFDPVVQDIEGWQVYIEPALLDGEHTEMGASSIGMLRNHLERVAVLVPEPALGSFGRSGYGSRSITR